MNTEKYLLEGEETKDTEAVEETAEGAAEEGTEVSAESDDSGSDNEGTPDNEGTDGGAGDSEEEN